MMAEAVAEVAADTMVVASIITTPPPSPTGGGLRSFRIAPALAVECLTVGAAPATTTATATTWPATAATT